MNYQLLGIDVDGTLLGPDHAIRPGAADAIAAARAKGMKVALATGRTYAETIDIWRQLNLAGPFEPMVLVGGALVTEPDTGRTLYQRAIGRELACQFADAIAAAGYAAMALVDGWRHGWDYMLCQTGNVLAARRDWLDKTSARVRQAPRLAEADDMPDSLRISAVADPQAARQLAEHMTRKFDGQLSVHSILAPNYGVTIVEAFAAGVDKFAALRYIGQADRIPAARIAAIGDDINDLGMIGSAGLGAAMPGAPAAVVDAADCVADGGLADFIDELATGALQ